MTPIYYKGVYKVHFGSNITSNCSYYKVINQNDYFWYYCGSTWRKGFESWSSWYPTNKKFFESLEPISYDKLFLELL